ncbi:MAG: HlyD family efflux transporter periplasmic adaptor subunit [Chloroflexi bacterium]|nr:HlyD family efflux transporter periplasmic adaptor subunit [Chloroflexota bacterium]
MPNDEIFVPERRAFPRRLVIVAVVVILAAAAGVMLWRTVYRSAATQHYLTAPVQRTTLADSVAATGPIAAATAVPLNFKNSGKVAEIDVNVGDQIKAGQVLAKLEPTDLQAQLRQAQANLAVAQAKLDGMLAGPRAEQVAQLQANVDIAKQKLATIRNGPRAEVVAQAQAALDSAREKLAAMESGPRPETVAQAQANLDAAKAKLDQLKSGPTKEQLDAAEAQVRLARNQLYSAQSNADAQIGSGRSVFTKDIKEAQSGVAWEQINVAEAQLAALKSPPTPEVLSQAQAAVGAAQQGLNLAKTPFTEHDLAQARKTVDAAQQQLDLAKAPYTEQDIEQAQATVRAAEQALRLAQTPYTKSDLDGARAQVAAQQALVGLAQANLDSATLTAPSDGVVTAINGAVGQWLIGGSISGAAASAASGANNSTSNATTNFISLTDLNHLLVAAQINEADIGRIAPGQPVSFTVDAFPNQTFDGTVAVVQPLGTTSQNVVSYLALISIKPIQAKLLPGMTANVKVTVDKRPDVLVVPAAAISFAQAQAAAPGQSSSAPGQRCSWSIELARRNFTRSKSAPAMGSIRKSSPDWTPASSWPLASRVTEIGVTRWRTGAQVSPQRHKGHKG